MSSPASNTSRSSGTDIIDHPFGPMYANQPEHSPSDPFGMLPYNRRIRATKGVVLEWDNRARALTIYYWPVLNGRRVPPSEFSELRRTHLFSYPSCLCAMESPDGSLVTESVVFMAKTPGITGEYVAACAQRKCKYFVLLERFYSKRGLPVRAYPLRAMGAPPPPPIDFDLEAFEQQQWDIGNNEITPTRAPRRAQAPGVSLAATRVRRRRPAETADEGDERAETSSQGRKRRRLQAPTVPLDSATLPTAAPLANAGLSSFRKVMHLDDMGLRLADFKGLLHVCSSCNDWVGTKNAFDYHNCSGPEIIDLTVDA